MERQSQPNPWEDWRFRVLEVRPDESPAGASRLLLEEQGASSRWLHTGFEVGLYPDECKGYVLNLTSGQPSWFVSYRPIDGDGSQVEVSAVSLSYIEADRRLFAQEQVETLPLPEEIAQWLGTYTDMHFVPEETHKVRARSFLKPHER